MSSISIGGGGVGSDAGGGSEGWNGVIIGGCCLEGIAGGVIIGGCLEGIAGGMFVIGAGGLGEALVAIGGEAPEGGAPPLLLLAVGMFLGMDPIGGGGRGFFSSVSSAFLSTHRPKSLS